MLCRVLLLKAVINGRGLRHDRILLNPNLKKGRKQKPKAVS